MKAEDLLTDESFLAWYNQSNPASAGLWEEKLKIDPQLRQEVEKAICLLQKISMKEKALNDNQTQSALEKLLSDLRLAK